MLERLFSRSRRFPQAVLPLALAVGALCYSSVSAALGLGELTLRSYLNQPFKADIDLTDTAGLDADDISAAIASPDAYSRAGIDRIFFLNDLHFTPDFSAGRKVIHVSSNKALTEPYLSFLVEVNRPGGQLLRAYTVLLDPPGTVALVPPPPVAASKPAVRAAAVAKAAPKAAAAPAVARGSIPPAPAPTAAADPQAQKSLDELRLRLQTLQSEVDVKNSQVATLETQLAQAKASPAAAQTTPPVVPSQTPAAAPAVPGPASVATTPAVPAAPAAGPAATPAPTTPVAPVGKPAVVASAPTVLAPVSEEDNSWYLMLGVAALLLLLIALLLVVRRNRLRTLPVLVPLEADSEDSALVKPAQASEAPVAAPVTRALAQQEPVAASRRETATATDALDGASIYIAYGRFNEALGILREGVIKQPDRTDLRLRILEVLGQQGDLVGFEQEEAEMLAIGFSAEKIQQVRQQSPKLAQAAKAVPPPAAVEAPAHVAPLAAVASVAVAAGAAEVLASPIAPPAPEPEPELTSLHTHSVAEPDFDFDLESLGGEDLPLLDDNPQAEESVQEFQLNLDDLSMDADWDSVSPFEPAPVVRKAAPAAPIELDLDEPLEVDPIFNTNLRELPDVLEMPDEQFLSDFADLDEPLLETDPVGEHDLSQSQDDIDNDFLNSFGADSDFDLDSLSVDFDSVESQQASAEKLEQAQSLIEIGDTEGASNLLHELLRDGDDSCKASARVLLAGL